MHITFDLLIFKQSWGVLLGRVLPYSAHYVRIDYVTSRLNLQPFSRVSPERASVAVVCQSLWLPILL